MVRMTLTEKILARASGRSRVEAGENVWVNTDILLTHDVCGPGSIGVFKREFGNDAKVWDPKRIVIIPDHYIFTTDRLSNRNVDVLREFAKEQGLSYFYDVIDDPDGHWAFNADRGQVKRQYGKRYQGVCHTALPRRGHARPGEVLFGTDSHTCMAGAFGEFATGIGNTDAGFILGTGKLLVKVPETMRFYLEGELPKGVMAKDVILNVIGDIGFDGATYRAMQWEGPGAAALNIDDRMTITNMAIEAGAKNGIFPADKKTFAYVDERTRVSGTQSDYEPAEVEKDQKFVFDKVYDLSKLEPTVAMHPNPGNRALARTLEDVKLDRAYIGSCTGGKTSDFVAFAEIVQGKQVRIETYGVPATSEVVEELKETRMQGTPIWDVLVNAGVMMTENASCAACLGGPQDTFGRLNSSLTCISATNRNFPGRMGSKSAKVYLASPYTVAASALTGRVTDPRDFI